MDLDLRPEPYTVEQLMANGGRLLVISILREMPYTEYLLTEHWHAVRRRVMKDAGWVCQMCPRVMKVRAVDAHHFKYENVGDERPGDVVALCRKHHTEWHELWKYKIRKEGEKQFRENPIY